MDHQFKKTLLCNAPKKPETLDAQCARLLRENQEMARKKGRPEALLRKAHAAANAARQGDK